MCRIWGRAVQVRFGLTWAGRPRHGFGARNRPGKRADGRGTITGLGQDRG
jgi:hypothetical protein